MFDHLKNRKLYRSPVDGLVFGVCSGLARYFEVDVIFVRLIVLAAIFFTNGWPMLLAYAVAVVLMPIDPAQDSVASHQEPKDVTPPTAETPSEPVEKMDANQNM
jgi:phage shock protein C